MTHSLAAKKQSGLLHLICGLLAAVCMMCGSANVTAQTHASGKVLHVSGTLSVMRTNGAMYVLGQESEVFPGDVLLTQRDSYAQVNFTDGSSLTMRPLTQVKLDAYSFVQDKPEGDSAFFRLLKGGMRTVTGLIGKRGNQDAYRIGTSTATIGIRGSVGDTIVCAPSCDGVVKGGETLQAGTHHETHNGVYTMQIDGKTAEFGGSVLVAQAGRGVPDTVIDTGGPMLLAQATPNIVVIEAGHSGYSNGLEIKLTLGGIGGGKVDLYLPTGAGLKRAAGCK